MTNSGDEEGFHPHPGDPWHPEWNEDVEPDDAASPSVEDSSEPTSTPRRGLFRRKSKRSAEPQVGDEPASMPVVEDDGSDEIDDGWDDIPATTFTATGETLTTEAVAEPAEPSSSPGSPEPEGPLPAWLSDAPPDEHRDPTLTVELPSWAGDTTVGADVVAGFEEEVDEAGALPGDVEDTLPFGVHDDLVPIEVEASEGGLSSTDTLADLPVIEELGVPTIELATEADETVDALVPAAEDLEVALRAIGALDEDVEVVSIDDEPPPLFEPMGESPAPLDPIPEVAAAASEYGVAGKEAFEALRDIHDEDLGEWEEFASADAAAAPRAVEDEPGPEAPRPEAFDEWVADEPPRRRGIWPFRRNRDREDDDAIVEEAADWTGDATEVPPGWFAEVDEDTVVPPGGELPETEWPEPVPSSEPGAWQVPTGAGPADAITADSESSPEADIRPMIDDALAVGAEESDEYVPAFDPGLGFDTLGDPDDPQPTPSESNDALFRPPDDLVPAGQALVPSADDVVPPSDDDDEWVTGPIELGSEYDDATVELPAGYASADDITQQIYTTSATMEHRGFAEELTRTGDDDTEWQAMSAAMPGVGTGVVGFDDVADLGDDEDVYLAPTRSELGTRVITGVVLVGFLLGSVAVGGAAAAAFIGVLVALGLGEFYGTLRHRGFRPLALFGYLGGIGLYTATWFHGPVAVPVGIGLTAVFVFFVYAFAPMRRDALTNGGLTVLGVAWVIGAAAFAVPILRSADYRVLVMAIVVVTAAMDVGAYSVGRTWGKRALAPILSPNKSVEGLVGGIAACMAAAVAFGLLVEPFDLKSGIALGVVVCVVAPIGDLAESMVKRSLGVKDMGAVLPGHGGILDRIDAFLFVLPAAWVLFMINGLIG